MLAKQEHERNSTVPMFHDRRRLRRWAAQLLLAWLFGLATGVVNACVIGESARDPSSSEHHTQGLSWPHDEQAGGEAAHENCRDFCAKSSIGVPPVKLVDDGSAATTFVAIESGYPVIEEAGERTGVVLPAPSPHERGGPPLRIAYRRLAL